MATLEKIRSKSTLLLIVVGVALFLFIIMGSERVFASFFGPGNTIAKVDGHSIDVQDFSRRVEEAGKKYQAQGRNIDQAQLQAEVLQEMIYEALMDDEIAKLGIDVTEEELTNFMFKEGAQIADAQIQQMTGGQIQSAQMLYDLAFNPSKYGITDAQQTAQFQSMWTAFEKDTEKQLKQAKFFMLFQGALVANELDAEQFFNDNTRASHITFAKQDYSTLDDKDFEVTAEEVKAEWEKTKNLYRTNDETRSVSFITVAIQPSANDQAAAKKAVDEGIAALDNGEGASGLADNEKFVVTTKNVALNSIRDSKLKAFFDSVPAGKAGLVQQRGNDYYIAKLLKKDSQVDSVNVSFFDIEGKAALDSILKGLNDGSIKLADVKKDSKVHPGQDSTWVTLSNPGLDSQLKAALTDKPNGEYFTLSTTTNEGGRIFCVNNRKAAVPMAEYVEAIYTASPSNATINTLLADLNKYIADNNTAELFKENAAKAKYNVQEAYITPSSTSLNNVRDSRAAVHWAMKEGKKGQVSPVFGNEQTGNYIVVAINDVYKSDYIPYNDPKVYAEIEKKLRNDKKGDALVNKYKGKANDIQGYAGLMNTQADTTVVVFARPMVEKFNGMQSNLNAAVASAKPGQLVAPIKANDCVVAFVVDRVEDSTTPYNFDQAAQGYNQSRGGMQLSKALNQVLLGRKKVKNNSLHFYHE